MVMKRLGAVVVAVGLIAGALVFRNWRDSGGTVSLAGSSLTVVCDEAIIDACRAAFDDVRSAQPGDTFDDLVGSADTEPFVWVTADVWFDMIDDERARGTRTPTLGARSDPLVHSPLVFAGPGVGDCSTPAFGCLADRSLDAELGIEDRNDSSAGLLAVGQLAFERNQRSNAELRWTDGDGIDLVEGPTRSILNYQNAAGRYDLVVVTDAAFSSLGPDDTPIAPADIAVTVTIGARVIGDANLPRLDALADALTDTGWTAGPGTPFDGPSAGGLIALRRA